MPVDLSYKVYIYDPSDTKVTEMIDYCHEFQLEFISYTLTDLSDVSMKWDTMATFAFKNERDAMIFKLRW